MPRYFIEVAYKGSRYSGFQIQENANTIQAEIEKAFTILHRNSVVLTGSSRTDTGVHALQNYFHFDYRLGINPQFVYKMNAILPEDIAIRNIHAMPAEAHCRFDATSREYIYKIHMHKDPFRQKLSFFYPYKLDIFLLHEAAACIQQQNNFFAFCKTNTQVKNFKCTIYKSQWIITEDELIYNVEGNRFLRGMVRLLTATLLKVGRQQLSMQALEELFNKEKKCGYSVPAQGLFLKRVNYPQNYFPAPGLLFAAI